MFADLRCVILGDATTWHFQTQANRKSVDITKEH